MTDVAAEKAATIHQQLTKSRLGQSWGDVFGPNGSGDVWVQNISHMQISIELPTPYGVSQKACIPVGPDPVNLVEETELTFEVLKNGGFQRTINRRSSGKPLLLLLNEEQVHAYYAQKAKALNAVADGQPDVAAAMEHCRILREKQKVFEATAGATPTMTSDGRFVPPKTALELMDAQLAQQQLVRNADGSFSSERTQAGTEMYQENPVHPKIMDLCLQVNMQLAQVERMSCDQFMMNINMLSGALQEIDWLYIESHGTYPEAKALARENLRRLNGVVTEGGGVPVVEPVAAPLPLGNQQQPASLSQQQGGQWDGPTGFANAPVAEAGIEQPAQVLGPTGAPLPPSTP